MANVENIVSIETIIDNTIKNIMSRILKNTSLIKKYKPSYKYEGEIYEMDPLDYFWLVYQARDYYSRVYSDKNNLSFCPNFLKTAYYYINKQEEEKKSSARLNPESCIQIFLEEKKMVMLKYFLEVKF